MSGPGWLGFELDLAAIDAAFEADRSAYRIELEHDTLAPRDPPDLDEDQQQLFRSRGGKVERPPPSVEELLACVPLGTERRRDEVEGYPDASDEDCAERVHWVYKHRGRGLTPADYAWQREWTVARAIGFGFLASRREMGKSPPDLPEFLGHLGGRGVAAFRRRKLLGMLVTADRMRKTGLTISGPELASLLGCATSTAWADLDWAERKGFVIRMRRYKPGREGAPVALAANWYGVGPALRQHRPLYWGSEQAALRFGVTQVAERKAVGFDQLRGRVRRQRRRHSRSRYEILCRYHGRPAPRRPGRNYVPRREWIRAVLDGAEAREAQRWALQLAGIGYANDVADLAAGIAQGELPGDWLDRLDVSGHAASTATALVLSRSSIDAQALFEPVPGWVAVAAELLERGASKGTALDTWLDAVDEAGEASCGDVLEEISPPIEAIPVSRVVDASAQQITIRDADGIPGSPGTTTYRAPSADAPRLPGESNSETPPNSTLPPRPTPRQPIAQREEPATARGSPNVRAAAVTELARAIEQVASPELRELLRTVIGPSPPNKR